MKLFTIKIGLLLFIVASLVFINGCDDTSGDDGGGGWVCPNDSQGFIPCL